MNWYPLLGLLALAYAGLVIFITVKKPEKLWQIGKIQAFVKVLGERGTEIFFYVFAVIFLVLGVWLFTL
jgi:hypothetical protein